MTLENKKKSRSPHAQSDAHIHSVSAVKRTGGASVKACMHNVYEFAWNDELMFEVCCMHNVYAIAWDDELVFEVYVCMFLCECMRAYIYNVNDL